MDWIRTSKARPCPVCGGHGWCAFRREGINARGDIESEWCKCMRRHAGDSPDDPSYRWEVGGEDRCGHWSKWVAATHKIQSLDDASRARWAAAAEARKAESLRREQEKLRRGRELATREWRAAEQHPGGGKGHSRVVEYLRARGIDLTADAVPRTLAFHPMAIEAWVAEANEWSSWPAMAACVTDQFGTQCGIHLTYLDHNAPKKRAGDTPRKKFGPCGGGAVRLVDRPQSRVLVLGEGIETTLSVAWSLDMRCSAWAALDATSLANLKFPADTFAPRTGVHSVWIAADLDANSVGEKGARSLAQRLVSEFPHITVEIRPPQHAGVPELVGKGERPLQGKGVDWNDVLIKLGADRLKAAFLQGFRPEDAASRSDTYDPQTPAPPVSATMQLGTQADEVKLMPEQPIDQARRFLAEKRRPVGVVDQSRHWTLQRWQGAWYEFTDGVYEESSPEIVRALVSRWASDGFLIRKGREEKQRVESYVATDRAVGNVVAELQGLVQVRAETTPVFLPEMFDGAGEPMWSSTLRSATPIANVLAFADGLLMLDEWRKGKLVVLPHTERLFTLARLPYPIDLPSIERVMASDDPDEAIKRACPTWHAFLEDVSSGSSQWIASLQEWFGYSLTTSREFEKILVIQGPTRSGKGTIERTWMRMLGERNVGATSFSLLSQRFHLSTLVGRLLAVMSDAHIGRMTDSTQAVELLKAISGGDAVPIETKYSSYMPSIRLPCKVVIYCNEPPSMQDSSGALAGRLHVLPMVKSYLGKEDIGLKARLAGETRGVLLWALMGLRRLWTQGYLTVPVESANAADDFARSASPLVQFVADHCVIQPDASIATKELYEAWKVWCRASGHQEGSLSTLSRRLNGAYAVRATPTSRDGGSVRFYRGIKLHSPPPGFEPSREASDMPWGQ